MSEYILIPENVTDKKEKYELLLPQISALIEGEPDLVANLANITAALKYGMNFFWVGVYLVKEENRESGFGNQAGNRGLETGNWKLGTGFSLVLGPFQGPVACTRIGFGKGVCGTSWKRAETIIVENVDEFPGHIACNSLSKSEIVVPFFKNGNVAGVLDVDSDRFSYFDETDAHHLQKIAALIENLI
jgi:L-methionine (R)-S-oxide reductase